MPRWYLVWGPVRAILQEEFTASDIRLILGLSGLDATTLQAYTRTLGRSKGDLMIAVDAILADMDEENRERLLMIAVDEILSRRPELEERLDETLTRLGVTVVDGLVIPMEIFDPVDLEELPGAAGPDLTKAAVRLRNGDLSGAVSAACGAVDSASAEVYDRHGEQGHGTASFQEKVSVSLRLEGAYDSVQEDLRSLGWDEKDAELLAHNLRQSLNSAAYVMQQLRSRMGDVHGSKPALRALVFDSVKWAAVLVRLLKP